MTLVFTLFALFASVFTVEKEAVGYAAPFFLVGGRMMFAGAILLLFMFFKNPTSLRLGRESLKRILLLSFFNIYLTNILELWGIQYLTSFKTCFLYSLTPFLSAFFSYLFLQEKLSVRKWVGLSIGFLGFIPMLLSQTTSEELTGHVFCLSWAELAVIVGVISSVLGWILLKQLVSDHCPATVANGYSMLLGGALALAHSCFSEGFLPVTNWPIFLKSALFLIIISNIIGYNLYGYLLKRFSPTFMAFAGSSTPIFTAIFGFFFFGETVTPSFFISLFTTLLGLYIFWKEELQFLRKKTQNDTSSSPSTVVSS